MLQTIERQPIAPALSVTEAGLARFDWWPDWRGKAVAIVASGPSAKSAGVDKLRGRLPVIGVKEAVYELCPWADVAYGCDVNWWKHRKGLQQFRGVKLGFDPKIVEGYPDVKLLKIPKSVQRGVGDTYVNDIQMNEPGVVGGGRNSGFQAFNFALQCGARRILLVAFDMRGDHWYGRNQWPKSHNASDHDKAKWAKHFDDAAPVVRSLGVEVVNASMVSVIKAFPKKTIDQALADWGL